MVTLPPPGWRPDPFRAGISAPLHSATGTLAVAGLVVGGAVAATAAWRAFDSDRSTTDRLVSGGIGLAALAGMTVAGFHLQMKDAKIGDAAMRWASQAGHSYEDFAWPRGTEMLTKGNGTWWVTPYDPIGGALLTGGRAGGFFGAIGGGIARSATQ
jgi:hypothetical protein